MYPFFRSGLIAAGLALCLAACGGGGGKSNVLPPGGTSGAATQTANFFPLIAGEQWQYAGSLSYSLLPSITVNGQTVYPYQGGCNEWEFLYSDSSNNVYSIGQNVLSPSAPTTIYPQPELLVKGTLTQGDSWTNNLGSIGTEKVTVSTPTPDFSVLGTTEQVWNLTYADTPGNTGTTTYAPNVGPVQVTNWCTTPASGSALSSYNS